MALIPAQRVLLHNAACCLLDLGSEGASVTGNTIATITVDAIPPQDDGVADRAADDRLPLKALLVLVLPVSVAVDPWATTKPVGAVVGAGVARQLGGGPEGDEDTMLHHSGASYCS